MVRMRRSTAVSVSPGGIVASVEMLSTEVDRQLSEQRAQADAFATRSGLMTAATALLTGLLANSIDASIHGRSFLWIVGLATAMGILVLSMSRLMLGPSPSELSRWRITNTDNKNSTLLDAKLLTIEANGRALVRTEVAFGLQALLTVGGIFFIILQVMAT